MEYKEQRRMMRLPEMNDPVDWLARELAMLDRPAVTFKEDIWENLDNQGWNGREAYRREARNLISVMDLAPRELISEMIDPSSGMDMDVSAADHLATIPDGWACHLWPWPTP
jgi:hypothetical protein